MLWILLPNGSADRCCGSYYPMVLLMCVTWDVLKMGRLETMTSYIVERIVTWVVTQFCQGPFDIWDISLWNVLLRLCSVLGRFVAAALCGPQSRCEQACTHLYDLFPCGITNNSSKGEGGMKQRADVT